MKIELRLDADKEIIPCRNCDFPVATMDATEHNHNCRLEGPIYLCEVCASTMLSVATFYPDQCSDPRLYKALGWIANKILKELR